MPLCQLFTQAFLRILKADSDDEEDYEDEGSLAAVGCIAGINSILHVMKPEVSAEQIPQMEPMLLGLVNTLLAEESLDFLDEVPAGWWPG